VPVPTGVDLVRVETAEEMQAAVEQSALEADVLVMAAAPADFRPEQVAGRKIRKAARPDAIALVETPDILRSTIGKRKTGSLVVGFALETHDALTSARAKLEAKALDLIVVNDATEFGAGFEVDTNRVTLIAPGGAAEELPLMSKADVADAILDRVEAMLSGR
jgi:phosphopantothenoylcysteine decarboxylase/phosphopantothenate--cysteine ligase